MKKKILGLILAFTLLLPSATVADWDQVRLDSAEAERSLATLWMQYIESGEDRLLDQFGLAVLSELDRLDTLVVESCYEDWHRMTYTYLKVLYQMYLSSRAGRTQEANVMATTANVVSYIRSLEIVLCMSDDESSAPEGATA